MGNKEYFHLKFPAREIPGGHYIIALFGQQRTGSYIEDGDRETLTLDNVYMNAGRHRGEVTGKLLPSTMGI